MKLKVSRAEVWATTIEDKPGGLANKLEALAKTGASLEFILARRAPERGLGRGVVFLTPLVTDAQEQKAVDLGFTKTDMLHSVCVEGADAPSLGAKMTRALASAGINLRGLSAAAVGRRCVTYFAFDTEADATKAVDVLERL